MNAEQIVRKMANNEGFPIAQSELAEFLASRLCNQFVFQYGDVVFTVSKDSHIVHIYADESGHGLMGAAAKFMSDVWPATGFEFLAAPILNSRLQKCVIRFGWKPMEMLNSGHQMFYVGRPKWAV
jgi:hypothetical protein